ncbi:MAG TPA: 2-oxo-4-hydroxy-4-carboxy-5-ureidoimidazoline decarboxylase [Actinoplanes sp.]|jgi:2-oxo-4-hydroxy-4-carboxy-5-ureidoimidazoline decarboxylase
MDAVEGLEQDLGACCAAPAWSAAIMAKRPFPDRAALLAAADAASRGLSWEDVLVGLAAHPRIGERAAGDSREAAWSRREQSVAGRSEELVAANRAYEQRFGHVFLIFASGRSQDEIIEAARRRRENDDETEREVVKDELRKIALLRLERLLDARG